MTTTTRNTGLKMRRQGSAKGRVPEVASHEEEAQVDELKPIRARVPNDLSEGITIRLDQKTLRTLRERAHAQGIGPTTLIRMWLLDRLQE